MQVQRRCSGRAEQGIAGAEVVQRWHRAGGAVAELQRSCSIGLKMSYRLQVAEELAFASGSGP